MGRIYKDQSNLKITVTTYTNLLEAEECLIKFRKPDKTTGYFTATISDEEAGIITYEVEEGDIDLSGWWKFWAYISFLDGKTAPGRSRKIYVWEEGE
jgi:hypothetical protein